MDQLILTNILAYVNTHLNDEDRCYLQQEFTVDQTAVFQMGKWKASGPDGFPAGFF